MNCLLKSFLLFISIFLVFNFESIAQKQKDSELNTVKKTFDTSYKPRTAIIRSAIIPGWGQITNKKYWKLPLVYGALGTTTY